MIVQRSFKKSYAENLKLQVQKSTDIISLYSQEEFPIDSKEIVLLPGIEQPLNLINKMIPTSDGDFKSAVALYEAYSKLTPLQAADDIFWTYLAHADLFKYVQQRFPKVLEPDFGGANYIIDHWFSRKTDGNILKRHWWSIHFSIDNDLEDKYRYTKILFTDYATRTNNFIGYKIARHKEAAIGILKFFYDNEDVYNKCFRGRMIYITKYFNRMGGSKNLVALDRNFFYNELMRIKKQILAINSEEDARDMI